MKRKLFGKAASLMLALGLGLGSVQFPAAAAAPAENSVIRPTVNYMTEPLGIDAPVSFGWQLSSNEIGQKQTAYDITVENESGDVVWRSGKTQSSETVGIACDAENLEEGEKYNWSVKVFGSDGRVFAANGGSFEIGVTNDEQWKSAQFICLPWSYSAPVFRRVVPLKNKVMSARLYITAVGVYDAQINGQKVYKTEDGKKVYHHMNPGYGNPDTFLTYETYDVTELIGEEEAAVITATAGTGWSDANANFIMGSNGGQPGIKAMLRITYENGEEETVVTDSDTWRGTLEGPITGNGVYFGEDYNATKAEALGEYWLPDYDDSKWVGAAALAEGQELGVIKNEFEPVSAKYMRIAVKTTGPAESGAGESLLQIMELEAYENGENIAKGIVPSVSNTWSPIAQWNTAHITDGDDGKATDAGYTSTVFARNRQSEYVLGEPVTLDFNFGKEVKLDGLKMYCRTKTGSVLENICPNYPKVYDVLVSDDGENWSEVLADYNAGDVYISDPGKLGTLIYNGRIKAASGMSGRIIDEFEQQPVSAVLYSGTKPQSEYVGGEIEIDEEYTGENIFENGIALKAGQTMVINMGQNMSAIPEIKVFGQRDTLMVMKFAEMLNDGSTAGDRFGNGGHNASGPKGSIYTHSLRTARSEARYVLAGNRIETYQPTTSFFGYQYIQLTADKDITVYGVRSRALSSVSRQTGEIETNNKDVNRLFLNALYGQLSNYFTIPTDCNQRDERLSWTGDAQAFANTALYNFDSMAFLNSFQDILSENTMVNGTPYSVTAPFNSWFAYWGSVWSDVQVVNIWELYQKTGDKSLIEKNWDALTRYMEFYRSHERGAYQAPNPMGLGAYGDWLAFQGTNHQIVSDYYYGYVTSLMAKMALITGRSDEAAFYEDYFQKQKEAFLNTHVVYNEIDEEAVSLAPPKNNEGENSISIPLENVNARFVRINVTETGPGTSNDNEYRLQIMEEEIYNSEGKNVALGKNAGTNNDFNAYGWTVSNLTDGKTDSGYSSKNNGTSYISSNPIDVTVDLGESTEISSVKLICRVFENTMKEGICPCYPKKFVVQTSIDGESWEDAGKYSVNEENENLLTIKSGTYVNGYFQFSKAGVLEDNSQTALLWMLKLGWYKDETMKQEAIRMLVENIRNENPSPSSIRSGYGKNTLAVGFAGSNVITPVLTDMGKASLSYDLLLNTELPSWLFEVKAGATTIWERWNSYDPENGFGDAEMNSFNHFAYGAVAEWMYRYMAGIDTEEGSGFGKIILQPTPDLGEQYNSQERIRKVNASYDSIRGKIETAWEADESGNITSYSVTVPANTQATLYLPVDGEKAAKFNKIGGVTYEGMAEHNGISCAKFALESGGYSFAVSEDSVTAALAEGYTSGIEPEIEKLEIKSFDGKAFVVASPETMEGKIIAAAYGEGNELLWAKTVDAKLNEGENKIELEEAVEIEGKTMKIMLWKGEILNPLCETLNIEQK